jgi:hypothetical protein
LISSKRSVSVSSMNKPLQTIKSKVTTKKVDMH